MVETLLLVAVVLADKLAARSGSATSSSEADCKEAKSDLVARCSAWLARYQPCFHPRSQVFRAMTKPAAVLADFDAKTAQPAAAAAGSSAETKTVRLSGTGGELNLDQLVQRQ